MMNVQEFIRANGVDALTEQFTITVKKYDNGYVKLNYSQIDSPKNHPLVDECRGLTLQVFPDNTSQVIARAFPRFYNLGECGTEKFDFANSIVAEKADGSLVLVFWSPMDNKWCISTRGMTYAEGNFAFSMTAEGGTFLDWILKTMRLTEDGFQDCMENFNKAVTYVMEYTAFCNRIVTLYAEDSMVLLAVVHNETGDEIIQPVKLEGVKDQLKQCGMNVRLPKFYTPKSGAELVQLADSLPGLQEGFVIVNTQTNQRVKIKSKLYVAAHHLRGNGTPSLDRLMEVVLRNEQSELLAYFEEFRPYVEPIEKALARLLADAQSVYAAASNIESQKEFALAVKDSLVAPLMFRVRKEGTSVVQTFEALDINLQMKLLEKFLPQA